MPRWSTFSLTILACLIILLMDNWSARLTIVMITIFTQIVHPSVLMSVTKLRNWAKTTDGRPVGWPSGSWMTHVLCTIAVVRNLLCGNMGKSSIDIKDHYLHHISMTCMEKYHSFSALMSKVLDISAHNFVLFKYLWHSPTFIYEK